MPRPNLYFARAIGAARSGDTAAARQEIERLAAIQAALGGAKGGYDWAKQVQIQHQAAAAWLAQAEGKTGEAERLLRTGGRTGRLDRQTSGHAGGDSAGARDAGRFAARTQATGAGVKGI